MATLTILKRPAQHSPPDRSGKKSKAEEANCLVCEKVILEADDDTDGHEALFCEGECQGWIHRQCAGFTRVGYDKLGESAIPFLCNYCSLVKYRNEIDMLKDTINSLSAKLKNASQPITPQIPQTMETEPPVILSATGKRATDKPFTPNAANTNKSFNTDRKFNIVVYNIKESPPGTARLTRIKSDTTEVSKLFSSLDSQVTFTSIRDCFRLGKFVTNSKRPRPLLVKLNRSADVMSLLSLKTSLPDSIVFKPDLSPQEQAINSLLLKERWLLIQSGVQRKSIKLRADSILVNGKVHGKVSNGIMELITRDCIQPEPTLSGGSAQSGPSTANGPTEPHNDLIATISDSNQTTTTALAPPMDQQPLVADHNQTS